MGLRAGQPPPLHPLLTEEGKVGRGARSVLVFHRFSAYHTYKQQIHSSTPPSPNCVFRPGEGPWDLRSTAGTKLTSVSTCAHTARAQRSCSGSTSKGPSCWA